MVLFQFGLIWPFGNQLYNGHIADSYMFSNEILRFRSEIEIDISTGGH